MDHIVEGEWIFLLSPEGGNLLGSTYMCELMGMESNAPTDIAFSFSELALRGGAKGPHSDGWGLALYDGSAVRTFLEPTAASRSTLASYVRCNPMKTLLAIAHIRKKTRGECVLANTHPFVRELWGRSFTFAHNGTVRAAHKLPLGRFRPIGDTDSEYAFCALLAGIEKRLKSYPKQRHLLWEAVAETSASIGRSGTFNFLLGDGTHLFARCATKLCYVLRKAPFSRATLVDSELTFDFTRSTKPTDRIAVVATVPLTRDEAWTHGNPGQLWVFRGGSLRATLPAA